jgi:HlyD family secretion protein
MTTRISSADSIEATLGLDSRTARRHRWRRVLWIGIAVAVVLAIAASSRSRGREPATHYTTDEARRGELTVTVTATGSLQPITQVKVGTEISGVVDQVNVDFNSPVKVGQVLARVNTDKLQAQAAESRGVQQAAEASLRQAEATVAEARSELARFEQVRDLSGGRVPSKHELDNQEATLKRALADQASATAQIAQSQAKLSSIETDLRKALIRSPINGLVLDRQIDAGQTVAASFQTPVLFTLAEDLTHMKLSIDVDEADVGKVRVGQDATFRVDAYGTRRFPSKVSEVRSIAKTSGGVVTYETILSVNNAEQLLRPGMTATAEIVVQHVVDALLVPNAALRFTPPAPAPASSSWLPGPPAVVHHVEPPATGQQRVWVLTDGQPAATDVVSGVTDGKSTEIVRGGPQAGALVIVDATTSR